MVKKARHGFTSATERKPINQVAVVLDPASFGYVDGIATQLGKSRAEVARRLIEQGIRALRVAAQAQDAGLDVDSAVVDALGSAFDPEPDTAMTLSLLDLVNDHLEAVERRDPGRAILLASGAATALRRWTEQEAQRYGTSVEELMRVAQALGGES